MRRLFMAAMVLCAALAGGLADAHPAAAQEGPAASVSGSAGASGAASQYCDPPVAGAAGAQYGAQDGEGPCGESPAAAADAAEGAAGDASAGAGEGAEAFERGVGTADLARKHGITRLPETGGAPLPALAAGLALAAGGAAVGRATLRR